MYSGREEMWELKKKKKKSRSLECIIKFSLNAKVHIPPTENKTQVPCKRAFSSFIFNAVFSRLVSAPISRHHILQ